MAMLAMLLSSVAQLVEATRRRRCAHRMAQMTDGPICRDCGRFWMWSD